MPTTISKLKKKLDKIFSEFIRRRNADHLGRVKCFTCGVEKHWKEQQAGHFQLNRVDYEEAIERYKQKIKLLN